MRQLSSAGAVEAGGGWERTLVLIAMVWGLGRLQPALPAGGACSKRGTMDLEIVVRKETGEIAEVLLRGRIDVQTAELLKTRVTGLLGEGYRHILLNMRRIKFIDSVGLGSLIGARRRVVEATGSLRLVHVSPAVAKALEMTHLTDVFDVHESTQEAVAALARGA